VSLHRMLSMSGNLTMRKRSPAVASVTRDLKVKCTPRS
jgi:hypothetical protein